MTNPKDAFSHINPMNYVSELKHKSEPTPATKPEQPIPQMTGDETAREILYRLRLAFGDQWPQRLVQSLNGDEKSRLFDALMH
jgi:hypothetical protein